MISATNSTPLRRRMLRLLPILAVLAGTAAWAPSSSAQASPPATMEFTVTPDEFEADGTFTVTIEGSGCVDPDGPSERPLTAVFWLKGGAVGSDGNDLVVGEYAVEGDGSYVGSTEVQMTVGRYDFGSLPAENLIEGICTYNWLPTDPSDIVASGQQEILVVAPPQGETIGSLPPIPTTTATGPSAPDVTTPPAAAQGAQPVASSPAYTG